MAILDTISRLGSVSRHYPGLEDYEDEDIFDVVAKLEKSFGLKFEKDAFYNIRTFGDLCEVFESYVKYEHSYGCTKQQAFYRVREAIVSTQGISRDSITLGSKLEDLFTRRGRRQKVTLVKNYLGVDIELLTYPGWLALTFGAGLLLSFLVFFISWEIALAGMVFFIVAINMAGKFGNTLDLKTVRELADKLAREHYMDVRRTKGTINRDEVLEIIIDTFSKDLGVDKADLKKEAIFSWTKNDPVKEMSATDDELAN